jgi:hypothetical protein
MQRWTLKRRRGPLSLCPGTLLFTLHTRKPTAHSLGICPLLFDWGQDKAVFIRHQGYVRSRSNRGGIDLGLKRTNPSHD